MKQALKALVPLVAIFSTAVVADEEPYIHSYLAATHIISLGGSTQDADAEIRANLKGRPGKSWDIDDLGLDDSSDSFHIEYRYNFLENWQLLAAAQTFTSDGKVTASTDIEFGDEVFPAGAEVKTSLSVDTIYVDLLYKVYRSNRAAIWLGGGLHAFDFDAEMSAKLSVGGESVSGEGSSSEILAPLPNLRAQAFYAFDDKWSVYGVVGWMSADIDDYSGSFSYLHAKAHYRFTDRFGFALGYQYTDVNVTRDGSHRESEFDIQLTGPSAQFTYAF